MTCNRIAGPPLHGYCEKCIASPGPTLLRRFVVFFAEGGIAAATRSASHRLGRTGARLLEARKEAVQAGKRPQ